MIKNIIRVLIGDEPKRYIDDEDTLDQVSDDFIYALNDIQQEYGVMFEFKKVSRKGLEWRLLPRNI